MDLRHGRSCASGELFGGGTGWRAGPVRWGRTAVKESVQNDWSIAGWIGRPTTGGDDDDEDGDEDGMGGCGEALSLLRKEQAHWGVAVCVVL